MPEYKSNQSKPEKILTGYQTVRGAELKRIYVDIEEMTPVGQIENRFGRPSSEGRETDHIQDCIRFLETLDMVEHTPQEVLNPLNQDVITSSDISFEAKLLYHIRHQTGNQQHLAEIFDVAIDEQMSDAHRFGVRRITVDELVVEVDRSTNYELEWREEKLLMWANLMAPTGAVKFSSVNDEVILSPSRALLFELLSVHQENRDNPQSLVAAFEWIDESFLPVFSRPGGRPAVHIGVADVLSNLVDDEVLTLTGMSDRQDVVDLPMSIDETETPADYSITGAPDRPAYWYPLEQSERRIRA